MPPGQEFPNISLADAEAHLEKMFVARRQCIDIWNCGIRAARLDIEGKRNTLRMGSIQPELLYMLQRRDKRRRG